MTKNGTQSCHIDVLIGKFVKSVKMNQNNKTGKNY